MIIGLVVTVGAAIAGFALMMGSIIASMMAEEDPHRPRSGVQIETTLPAMKAAWKSGDWRREGPWRRVFATAAGAGLLTFGLFGIFVVIAPWPVKILCAGAILYVAFEVIRGLRKA